MLTGRDRQRRTPRSGRSGAVPTESSLSSGLNGRQEVGRQQKGDENKAKAKRIDLVVIVVHSVVSDSATP